MIKARELPHKLNGFDLQYQGRVIATVQFVPTVNGRKFLELLADSVGYCPHCYGIVDQREYVDPINDAMSCIECSAHVHVGDIVANDQE